MGACHLRGAAKDNENYFLPRGTHITVFAVHEVLRLYLGPLGVLWGPFGVPLRPLGPLWGHLAASLGLPFGTLLKARVHSGSPKESQGAHAQHTPC